MTEPSKSPDTPAGFAAPSSKFSQKTSPLSPHPTVAGLAARIRIRINPTATSNTDKNTQAGTWKFCGCDNKLLAFALPITLLRSRRCNFIALSYHYPGCKLATCDHYWLFLIPKKTRVNESSLLVRHRATFPTRSIIAAAELNFGVRDGNRCILCAKSTGASKSWVRRRIVLEISALLSACF